MIDWNSVGFAPQGWQCPICKRVYSPSIVMCFFCGNDKASTTTTTGNNVSEKELNELNIPPHNAIMQQYGGKDSK